MRLLTLAAALVFAASAAGAGGPRVRLTSESPATVVGTAFRPAERVAVTVTAGETVLRKSVVATGEGRFVARWQRSIAGGCHATTVSAVGSRGSRAVYKTPPPECAPPQPSDR
jgi:hypothetical protein